MKYYMDGYWKPANYFWGSLQGYATLEQREMLLDGKEVMIGGVKYFIETIEMEAERKINQ